MIKIWVDDERERPEGYDKQALSVNVAIGLIQENFLISEDIEISLDHDSGIFNSKGGGDYVNILNWLECRTHCLKDWESYVKNKMVFHLHTANPVGRDNMRRIIQKNGWREV